MSRKMATQQPYCCVCVTPNPNTPFLLTNAMEIPSGHSEESLPPALDDYHSKVDTSRPFRSVKEAVVIFGERFLTGEIYSTPRSSCTHSPGLKQEPVKLESSSPICATAKPNHNKRTDDGSGSDNDPRGIVAEAVGRLQEEVEETKRELKLLKERESVTEVALASLNAELHRNMSKLAEAEAAAAARSSSAILDTDVCVKRKESKTLNQILRDDVPEPKVDKNYFGGVEEGKMKKKMMKKKKPITPLVVVDCLFSRRKGRSSMAAHDLNSPLYSTRKVYFA